MDAYEKSALAYDLIQKGRGRDYRAQAATLTSVIRARQPNARTLLDVVCGTGLHLSFLRETFDVAGLDISPAMIERTRLSTTGTAQGLHAHVKPRYPDDTSTPVAG